MAKLIHKLADGVRVQIVNPNSPHYGKTGVIRHGKSGRRYRVYLDGIPQHELHQFCTRSELKVVS